MKRKLIIHVGMGKTGSSSIQHTLRASGPLLQARGVKYLGLMLERQSLEKSPVWHKSDGWTQFTSLPEPQATAQLVAALQEIDQALPDSVHTLIWSNEALFNEVEQVAAAIEQLNLLFDITVVGYIRSPDSWIHSAYLQWGIKHKSYKGSLKSFPEWVKNKKFVVTPFINRWKQLVESVVFFNFEPIKDVCEHFITEYLPAIASDVKVVVSNETPSSAAIALFAYYNSLFEEEVLPNRLMPLLSESGVAKSRQVMPEFNGLLPGKEDISHFIADNRPEIDQINHFFEMEKQPPFDMNQLKFKDNNVSQQDINRALLQLVVHLSDEVERLKQVIKSQ
ncbi:hypothetical protein [Amphritea pacifica]|uniref:Sulfotransferase family protein n=1 Tax=Amphritea pacifica TaxID=2811233 RepID=A0ABS2W5T2_9GAMM|nr:hypothetical protein [Amphritea pacifica]MBN0986996.1 hypothetical protein [Amphritea pacifica]